MGKKLRFFIFNQIEIKSNISNFCSILNSNLYKTIILNIFINFFFTFLWKNLLLFNKKFYLINQNYIFNGEVRLQYYQIENSFFTRINTINGNGGIILINSGEINLNLENCIYFLCSCDSEGGVIYFLGNNVKLIKICVSNCFSLWNFQFSFIQTNLNGIYHLLSINNCYNNTKGYWCFNLEKGNISLSNINSSQNINFVGSSISILDPIKLNSIFCTIIDNYVSSHTIIYLRGNKNNYLSYYNIINNNSPRGNGIIHLFEGQFILNNSFLLNNKDTLFFSDDLLEIYNCKIIQNQNYIFNGNFLTSQIEINYYFKNTFFIIHYFTKYCNNNLNNQFTKIKYFNFNLIIIIIFLILENFQKLKNK